jgi:hypothetical protein
VRCHLTSTSSCWAWLKKGSLGHRAGLTRTVPSNSGMKLLAQSVTQACRPPAAQPAAPLAADHRLFDRRGTRPMLDVKDFSPELRGDLTMCICFYGRFETREV